MTRASVGQGEEGRAEQRRGRYNHAGQKPISDLRPGGLGRVLFEYRPRGRQEEAHLLQTPKIVVLDRAAKPGRGRLGNATIALLDCLFCCFWRLPSRVYVSKIGFANHTACCLRVPTYTQDNVFGRSQDHHKFKRHEEYRDGPARQAVALMSPKIARDEEYPTSKRHAAVIPLSPEGQNHYLVHPAGYRAPPYHTDLLCTPR